MSSPRLIIFLQLVMVLVHCRHEITPIPETLPPVGLDGGSGSWSDDIDVGVNHEEGSGYDGSDYKDSGSGFEDPIEEGSGYDGSDNRDSGSGFEDLMIEEGSGYDGSDYKDSDADAQVSFVSDSGVEDSIDSSKRNLRLGVFNY